MAASRSLQVVFSASTAQLQRGLGQLAKSADGAGKKLRRGVAAAAPYAAAGLAGLAVASVAAVKAASDLEESQNKANQVFGKSAKIIPGATASVAKALGMTRSEALDGAASIGAMLTAMGQTKPVSARMSKDILGLAADLGSFYNADPTDMLDRLRAGLSGESEPLKRFGILIDEARVKQEAYRMGIAKSGDELTQAQKLQARYSLIMRDSAVAQGDFARTSDGAANQARILRAQFGDLSAQLGTSLLPIVNSVMSFAIRLADVIRENAGVVKIAVIAFASLATTILALDAAFKVISTVALLANPIGAVIVGVVALGAAIAVLWAKSQTFRSIVTGAWNAVRTAVTTAWQVVGPIVRSFGQVIKAAFDTVVSAVRFVVAILRGDFPSAWQALKGIASGVVNGIVAIIRGVPMAMWTAAKGVLTAALRLGKEVVTKIAEGIGSMPGLIKQGLSRLFGLAGEAGAVNPYLSQIQGQGAKVPDAVAKGITKGKGKVSTAFSTMTGGAAAQAKPGAGTQGQGVGSSISSGIATGISSGTPQVNGAIAQVIREGIRQAKAEAGIKSPSAVMAAQVGAPMAAGVGVGFRGEMAKQGNKNIKPSLLAVVQQSVRAARSNLQSLAGGLGSLIGQAIRARGAGTYIDPATGQSAAAMRAAQDKALQDRREAELKNARDAAETEEERQRAVQELNDFYTEQRIAKAEEEQQKLADQHEKAAADAETSVANLAARFNQGLITADQFRAELGGLIGGETGASLGEAFAYEFSMALKAVEDQLKAIMDNPALSGVMGAEGPTVMSPSAEARAKFEEALANVENSLRAQYRKAHPKATPGSKAENAFVNPRLAKWKAANRAKYGIPLAKGGILRRAVIAGEAGPEAVIPLNSARAGQMLADAVRGANGSAGGPVIYLTVNGVMSTDVRDFARQIKPELDRVISLRA